MSWSPNPKYLKVCVLSHFKCVWLFVTLWTVACQAPLSMEFFRQEYWSGLPFSAPGDLPDSGIKPTISYVSCIGKWILYHWTTWGALSISEYDLIWHWGHCQGNKLILEGVGPQSKMKVKVLTAQSCLTLCDPMDCSPSGSSVNGTFQARTLECIAISFSKGSSPPRGWIRVFCTAGRFFTAWATREAQSKMTGVLIKRRNWIYTQAWGECHVKIKVNLSQPRNYPKTAERPRVEPCLAPPEGVQPSHHLDLEILPSGTVKQHTSVVGVIQFVVPPNG